MRNGYRSNVQLEWDEQDLADLQDGVVAQQLMRRDRETQYSPKCIKPAAFHRHLFRSQKSFRPAEHQTLSNRHPHSPHQSDGGMERRDWNACLNLLMQLNAGVFSNNVTTPAVGLNGANSTCHCGSFQFRFIPA
jgi:hypothetical protein